MTSPEAGIAQEDHVGDDGDWEVQDDEPLPITRTAGPSGRFMGMEG